MGKGEMNYLQIRGDRNWVQLKSVSSESSEGKINTEPRFEITDDQTLSWLSNSSDKSNITFADLRKGIEPWLTSLFQSEHLSLLIGSGLSMSLQNIAGVISSNAMATPELNTVYSDKIKTAAAISAQKSGHGSNPNIEDYIRVINELLVGLRILGHNEKSTEDYDRKNYDALYNDLNKIIKDFATSISKIENSIAVASKRESAFNYLVNFLMSFASRTGTRDRLNIFTTNYDRIIEAGAEFAGLRLIDRFVGTLTPIFNSSRIDIDMHYNPPGIRGEPRYLEGVARYTKLHGSIDWVDLNHTIRRIGLPFGALDIKPYFAVNGLPEVSVDNAIIYPNSSKDRETAEYPFVELFRDLAATLCRPNSTLVTYGYGFGDEHINRIISDMLTVPSTHLIILAYSDSENRIKSFIEKIGRPSQLSILLGKNIADFKVLVDHFLPKPSIDKASIRMSDLIKQRYSEIISEPTKQEDKSNDNTSSAS